MIEQDNGLINTNWRDFFDERQLKEIEFANLYSEDFHHGTDGHNAKMIMASMTNLLDTFARKLAEYQERHDDV